MSGPRWDRWLPGAYLALVALSAAYMLYRMLFAPANSEFSALPLVMLALPWSTMFTALIALGGPLAWLGIAAGVALNTAILRGLGRLLRGHRDEHAGGPPPEGPR